MSDPNAFRLTEDIKLQMQHLRAIRSYANLSPTMGRDGKAAAVLREIYDKASDELNRLHRRYVLGVRDDH